MKKSRPPTAAAREALKGLDARAMLASSLVAQQARTGEELLAFFRASPLVDEELSFERDPAPGRVAAAE